MSDKPKWRRATPEEEARLRKAVADGRVQVASRVRVDADPVGIAALLSLLGHPEALITDESRISDFLPDGNLRVMVRGEEIVLHRGAYLWRALDAIRELDSTWPLAGTTETH